MQPHRGHYAKPLGGTGHRAKALLLAPSPTLVPMARLAPAPGEAGKALLVLDPQEQTQQVP